MRHGPTANEGDPASTDRSCATGGGDAGSVRVARIVLAYDGTDFHGWQAQPGLRTVQGELATALRRIIPLDVLPPGAGRTDAGVHARGQVASAPVAGHKSVERLARALRRLLPEDVVALEVGGEPEGFHARFSARARHYAYRMLLRPDPLRRRDHLLVRGHLDVAAMREAAATLVGDHDCASFCVATSAEQGKTVCRIRRSELVAEPSGDALTYQIAADRFLHSMVRSIVGTLLEIGRGRRAAGSISAILQARDRRAAGVTAAALGLCLERVEYPPEVGRAPISAGAADGHPALE